MGFPGGSDSKASACNAGDPASIPGLGRSPGEGNANHYSSLAWKILWTKEPGRLQSWGRKDSDTTERLHFHFHSQGAINEMNNGNKLMMKHSTHMLNSVMLLTQT